MRFSFEEKDFVEQELEAGKLAVIAENTNLTWSEFELKVNRLCTFFQENNWDQLANPVIVYGHKQAEMIVAIYACIKMQLPYIPIDYVYPKDRILIVQKQAEVDLVINCSENALDLPGTTEIKLHEKAEIVSKVEVQLRNSIPSDPLVYIIFTSGSTGEPKGVQISTEAVRSFTQWMCRDFGFTKDDVFINVALFSFDLSVYELLTFGALGATLLLSDKSTTEKPELFLQRIEENKGTIWVSTPSYSFVYSRIENTLSALKYFLFCGEILPHQLAKALKASFKTAKILNTYGPTEATVATTLVEITDEIIEKYNPLPVGYPKAESQILIEQDEIVIVGKNVSLGYLHRPELNAEKFLVIEGERAFKTGDYGYLEAGMLFCKGRNDDQVKLHGYRIELNEITSKINEIAYVLKSETIALKRNEEVKKIVSLVQLKDASADLDFKQDILSHLAKNLPDYMLPADIKVISEIPLNQNGKSDKKMLEQIYLKGE